MKDKSKTKQTLIQELVFLRQRIDELERLEESLKKSEEKYRNLYSHSALGIFHSTIEGRFTDMNPSLARMLGYDSPEEAISLINSISEQVYAE